MSRFLLIPGEILSCRNLSPMEKFLAAFIYNTTKDGRECYASNEWLSVLFGCKESQIEKFLENLIQAGIVNEFAGRKSLAVSLEFFKIYTKTPAEVPAGVLN